MGVIYGYFAAADDDDAVRAVMREDDEPTATGYDGFDVNGMDPTVDLLPAEVILSGRSATTIQADPRHGHLIATADDGQLFCLSLTDALRDALAAADHGSLHQVARAWSASDVFSTPPDPDGLAEFLEQAVDLASRAVGRGHRLYCWICV
ncbi:hypothetical protein [Streptomyces sp. NPDC048489]|uniref:hypothetical protein n=1 Tax=Streptomyces sp. NPDC048489 TaxID=3154504 RepID=UPI003416FB84